MIAECQRISMDWNSEYIYIRGLSCLSADYQPWELSDAVQSLELYGFSGWIIRKLPHAGAKVDSVLSRRQYAGHTLLWEIILWQWPVYTKLMNLWGSSPSRMIIAIFNCKNVNMPPQNYDVYLKGVKNYKGKKFVWKVPLPETRIKRAQLMRKLFCITSIFLYLFQSS